MPSSIARDLRSVPNLITLSRIVLVVVAACVHTYWSRVGGIALAVLAGVTDYVDGIVARATGQVTRLGEILDQMSDLFFESLALLLLVQTGFVSPLYLVAYLMREFWVTSIRRFMAGNGLNIRSSFAGKLKTNVIMWSFLFAFPSAEHLLPAAEPALGIFARVALTAGIALGWWSAVDYTRQFFEGYDQTATRPTATPPTHVSTTTGSGE